jgi:hypothetical protein
MRSAFASLQKSCMIAEIDTSRFTSGQDLNRDVSILAIMGAVPPADQRGAHRSNALPEHATVIVTQGHRWHQDVT